VTGVIIRRTVLAFSIIPMEINTKEAGVTTNVTDKALIG
jgi:hypothetical protein